jgi:hypothetical protein
MGVDVPSDSEQSLKCSECDFVFPLDELSKPSDKHSPCPNCGSLKRKFIGFMNDAVNVYEHQKMGTKKTTSKHKNNRANYEQEQGTTFGKDGKLVFKIKVKDREHSDQPGSYQEYVRDQEGNIIVNKSEKLSEHKQSKRIS